MGVFTYAGIVIMGMSIAYTVLAVKQLILNEVNNAAVYSMTGFILMVIAAAAISIQIVKNLNKFSRIGS